MKILFFLAYAINFKNKKFSKKNIAKNCHKYAYFFYTLMFHKNGFNSNKVLNFQTSNSEKQRKTDDATITYSKSFYYEELDICKNICIYLVNLICFHCNDVFVKKNEIQSGL